MKKVLVLSVLLFCRLAFADTETINWYVGTTLYDTTSCQTGGDIDLPTPPTKRGYTFNGWTSGIYDMSTLNTTTNGIRYYACNADGSCYYLDTRVGITSATQTNCTNDNFSDLGLRQWKAFFDYGTVYGEGMCSDTAGGTTGAVGNPTATTSSSKQCWCRVTGFISSDNNMLYKPAVLRWAFAYGSGSTAGCNSNCTDRCGHDVQRYKSLRNGLYGK